MSVWRTIWTEPRETVQRVRRGDAAWFVIAVAWCSGVLDLLQSAAMRGSLKPNWGVFALFLVLVLGPLAGFAHLGIAGPMAAGLGKILGGRADTSDARVALACGTLPELLALPLWIPVLAVYGLEIFTTARATPGLALLAFAGLQLLLWLWSFALRLVTLAEVHEFSVLRAFLAVFLSWLVVLAGFVGLLLGVGAFVKK